MKREVNEEEEDLRLKNSTDLMYGNKDSGEVFPFDVRMRFKYLVYHEALGRTEDGQIFSKLSTRRYSFFSPTQWDTNMAPAGKKSWFEVNDKNYVILHDPILQAKLEGVKIKGYHFDSTGKSLKDKLRSVKRADQFVKEVVVDIKDVTTFDSAETEPVAPKKGRPFTKKESEVTGG